MSYIPGHEHYPGHNNWKRDMLYGCGDGSGYDRRPNPLDDGFHISNRTNIYVYGGNSNGGCHGSRGFLSGLLGGLTGANSCWSNESSLWGRLTGTLLSFGANLGLASLMNKWSGGSIYGTGFGGGGYQFYPTSWVGGGSSIFGSGFGGGYAGTGDMLINSTGMLPWSPVSYSGVGTNGNGTGGANNTGGATTNNNSQGTTPQNNNNQPVSPSNNDNNDSGNGTVISANEFNNAIDDIYNGKEKLFYGYAHNDKHNYADTTSENENINDSNITAEQKQKIKDGIKAGKANGEGSTEKTSEGYYRYITITDNTSGNLYTYQFDSVSGNQLKYKLSPTDCNLSKDDANAGVSGTHNYELSNKSPVVVITLNPKSSNKITLTSSDDYPSAIDKNKI